MANNNSNNIDITYATMGEVMDYCLLYTSDAADEL